MGVLPVCTDLCTTRMPGLIDPLKLEFQAVVSCHEGCWELNLGPLE